MWNLGFRPVYPLISLNYLKYLKKCHVSSTVRNYLDGLQNVQKWTAKSFNSHKNILIVRNVQICSVRNVQICFGSVRFFWCWSVPKFEPGDQTVPKLRQLFRSVLKFKPRFRSVPKLRPRCLFVPKFEPQT